MPSTPRLLATVVTLAALAAACTGGGTASAPATPAAPLTFPPAPPAPDGPVDPVTAAALDDYGAALPVPDTDAIGRLGDSGDPRVLWLLSDIIRFALDTTTHTTAAEAAVRLSGLDLDPAGQVWVPLTNHLIAWDLPAYPGYVEDKAAIFTAFEPRWAPFFADADAAIDWRLVTWGGVRIDDRPLGDPQPCPAGCIPALDDPALTAAEEGGWYPDDAIVFGVRIGGEAVALPRNIMEVHEMVNATIGGHRVAIPYCTLCGAAQVFFTDGTGIVMRTSGLLHRSNKVMFDLTTLSVFDTFTGRAVSGPLREAAVVLPQATVVTSTWADWRTAHPDTMIVARDGGIGRGYPADPLGGRDDEGPIFPIGDHDPRLDVHEQVLGVVLDDGTAVAFPAAAARAALQAGQPVMMAGVAVQRDAGGLVAVVDGRRVASHQAFWFAWSQFHPDTLLWSPDAS